MPNKGYIYPEVEFMPPLDIEIKNRSDDLFQKMKSVTEVPISLKPSLNVPGVHFQLESENSQS